MVVCIIRCRGRGSSQNVSIHSNTIGRRVTRRHAFADGLNPKACMDAIGMSIAYLEIVIDA